MGPILTSIDEYWKNDSFDSKDLCQESDEIYLKISKKYFKPSYFLTSSMLCIN